MKYKEFKRAVEDWGRIYGYKPIINVASTYIEIAIKDEDYVRTICAIHKSERFVMYLHWELYRSLSENVKDHLFKIVTEFAATKPEEREDKKDNLDEIINRLEVIQTNLEEIKERSRNLRNTLEDIIIDLEEFENSLNKRPSNCVEDIKTDKDIKFRAWHKATRQMYEVAQIDFYHEKVGYLFADPISQSEVIGFVNFSDIELMQFTGFEDDNGVEIYEGDIVESYMDNGYEYGMLAGVVEFVDGCYFANNTLLTDLLDYIQVIGNKYEIKGN